MEKSGKYKVAWYNPREGGELQAEKIVKLKSGNAYDLGNAPAEEDRDWVLLLVKE